MFYVNSSIGLSVLCMSIIIVFRLIIMCHISDQGIDRRIITVHYCDYDDDDFFLFFTLMLSIVIYY